jgi:hypothetical protein
MECAMTNNNSGSGILKMFVVLAFLIVAGITISYIVSTIPNDHALARHGAEATMAHKCINDGGTIQGTFVRQSDGHKATICQMNNMFYVYIEEECGSEVTAMCKNKMTRLEQVEKYLGNRDYVPQKP